MRKQRKRSLGETLADAAELPKEIALGLPKITIIAQQEATVENYKGIIEYDNTRIRLYTSAGVVAITGEDLEITEITDETITAAGNVTAVTFAS